MDSGLSSSGRRPRSLVLQDLGFGKGCRRLPVPSACCRTVLSRDQRSLGGHSLAGSDNVSGIHKKVLSSFIRGTCDTREHFPRVLLMVLGLLPSSSSHSGSCCWKAALGPGPSHRCSCLLRKAPDALAGLDVHARHVYVGLHLGFHVNPSRLAPCCFLLPSNPRDYLVGAQQLWVASWSGQSGGVQVFAGSCDCRPIFSLHVCSPASA